MSDELVTAAGGEGAEMNYEAEKASEKAIARGIRAARAESEGELATPEYPAERTLLAELRELEAVFMFDCDREEFMEIAARYEQQTNAERTTLYAQLAALRTSLADAGRLHDEELEQAEAERLDTGVEVERLTTELQSVRRDHRRIMDDLASAGNERDRANRAEQRLVDMSRSLPAILADAEALNADIGKLSVNRTSRDSDAERTQNAWKSAIIDLIGPRTQRIADRLTALLTPTAVPKAFGMPGNRTHG